MQKFSFDSSKFGLKGLSTTLLASSIAIASISATAATEKTLPFNELQDASAQQASQPQAFTIESLSGTTIKESSTVLENTKKDANDEIQNVITEANNTATEITNVGVVSDTSSDPLAYELPESERNNDLVGNDDTTIDSIIKGTAVETTTTNTQTGTNQLPPGTKTATLSQYAAAVNKGKWTPGMKKVNTMTVKLQALLDWNHASPGPIDGGWGMNSKKALKNFQAMKGLKQTGRMDQATWNALTAKIPDERPVLVEYTISKQDANTRFMQIPSGYPAKSKLPGMYYNNIYEMFAERFHMDINYLKKLNKGKKFVAGQTITVYNPGLSLNETITRVVANKKNETLYAYNGNKLVATYPTTVGSSATPSPHGTYKIVNKVKMPWYNATVGEGATAKKYKIAPGPNNPVGVVWMGLSRPSYGLHGSPVPEGISRQASHGCIRLTNWDVLEVYANIKRGATVELK